MDEYIELIVAVLSGLATAIPLVVQLVKYIKTAMREKNWNDILKLVMEYMKAAEGMFESGAERKKWVMESIVIGAKGIDYPLDDVALAKISDMIDSICDAAKEINVSPANPAVAE